PLENMRILNRLMQHDNRFDASKNADQDCLTFTIKMAPVCVYARVNNMIGYKGFQYMNLLFDNFHQQFLNALVEVINAKYGTCLCTMKNVTNIKVKSIFDYVDTDVKRSCLHMDKTNFIIETLQSARDINKKFRFKNDADVLLKRETFIT